MGGGAQDVTGIWQQFADALPYPAFIKDCEGRYLGCNLAFADHIGIPPSRILGLTVFDLAPPELALVYKEADESLLRDGGTQVYESKVRYADGTIHDIRFRKIRLEGENGAVIGLAGFMEDITERRRVEQELAERHGEIAGALRASSDLVFLIDSDLRFLPLPYPHVEEADHYLMPPSEFLGRTLAEVLPGPLASRAAEIVGRVLASGRSEDFSYDIVKGGERLWYEARAVRMQVDNGRSPRCLLLTRDITKRRASEVALKVHASVIAVMPIGFLLCRLEDPADNRSLTIRAVNAAAEKMFACPGGQLVGRRSAEMFPRLVETGMLDQFVQLLKSGRGMQLPEFVYGDERMPERTYGVKVEPLGDRQLAFLFEDVTERLEAEARERERRALYYDLAESSLDAVYRVSLEGGIEYISGAAERILGYTPAEMVGKPFAPYLEPGEIPRAMTAFLKATMGGPTQYLTFAARRKDGSRVMIEVWSTPIRKAGRIVSLQGGLRDVSEQFRAAEALRLAKERLEHAHRLARLGEWEWDMAEDRMTWSPAFYKICGFSADVSPTQATILDALHPDDREAFTRSVNCLVAGKGQPVAEYRIIRPGGELRHISISTTVSYGGDGRPARMQGVIQDVTEQKILQQRTVEAEAFAAVGRVAGQVAHEVNNPLAAMAMRLEMLRDDRGNEAACLEHLRVLEEQEERIRVAIQRLVQRSTVGPSPKG